MSEFIMKRHTQREHRHQPYASKGSKFVVKVNHIPAKSITKYELGQDRKGRELRYTTVNLLPGKDGCDDFGYINCEDEADAKHALSEWDGRIICGQRVSALIQRSESIDAGPSTFAPPIKNTASTSKDLKKTGRTLKVLIGSNGQLTAKDLESYFETFGTIETRPFICKGTPDYAYINYESPQSAIEACKDAKLQIKDTTVSVKLAQSNAPPIKSVECKTITCDPLVAKSFVSNRGIKEFFDRNQAILKLTHNGFEVWVEKQSLTTMLKFIMKEMETLKKQIVDKVLTPHCYHLPTLCNPKAIENLIKLQEKHQFSLEILDQCEKKSVTLQELEKQLCQPFVNSAGHPYVQTVDDRNVKRFLDCAEADCQWQWEADNGVYIPYHQKVCCLLNQQSQLGPGSTQFKHTIGAHTYNIDLSTLTQTNVHTKKQRTIRKVINKVHVVPKCHIKLKVRAHTSSISSSIEKLLKELGNDIKEQSISLPETCDNSLKQQLNKIASEKLIQLQFVTINKKELMQVKGASSYIGAVIKDLKEHLERFVTQQTRTQLGAAVYPTTWEPQETNIELKEVTSGKERGTIESLIHRTMSKARILSVKRIQNKWLWERYCFSKQRMSDKNKGVTNEQELFHGTRSTPPEKIYKSEQGFDFRFSTTGMWGTGTYFAVSASYSNTYAFKSGNSKQMILAKVLTGETVSCRPDSSLKKPPLKNKVPTFNSSNSLNSKEQFEDERYDSVNGHTNGSDVFVVYDHEKAYPAYLIEYRE